ncbi:MAG: hypothetical protein ABIE43_05905 [Patescibacteria group bacterium]
MLKFCRKKNLKLDNIYGFSILEVIIAIFIITMGLIGVLSLIVQNVQVQYINKNNLIASQLAQEGLELTRNVRDKSWLDPSNPWVFTGIAEPDDFKTFTIDFIGITDGVIISDAAAELIINNDFYVHGLGEKTNFSRIIETTNDYTNSFIAVSSIVQWGERGQFHQYIADTVLYDWR